MGATFVNFSTAQLSVAAGGDPWKVNDELQAGDAGAINDLADAFHQAGVHVQDADDEFAAAKKTFADAYHRPGGVHPINDSAEVQKVSAALAGHPEQLTRIAADLEQTAAALATAQRDSAAEIESLDAQLHTIDDEISTAIRSAPPILVLQLFEKAGDATKAALAHVEAIRGAYTEQLHGAETAMMASGYVPDVLDTVDALPGEAPGEAARQYDLSGQRAKDQAIADAARKAKGDGTLGWTQEEQDAAQRLEDYLTITDPAHGVAHRGNDHDRDLAARLAGERLSDYNMAQSVGAVARDPVLGGDARDRANARLKLQHDLETGQLPSSPQPMTPDDATLLMDRMEVTARANAVTKLQEQLQQAGMSSQGAAAVAESMAHGVIPHEYVDAASAAGKVFDAGETGIGKYGELSPTGRHWAPGVAFSAEDIEALKKLGSHVGAVGSVIELGTGIYEIFGEGKSPVEVVGKAGGSLAGAWAFGEAGAWAGGAVGGPPGAFVGALVLGTVGGFVGEDAAEKMIKWLEH